VVLSTLHVNTFVDTVAKNPKVSPVDNSGNISVRSAIQFADANPTKSDTIILQAGTYNLTIAPNGDGTNDSGSFDILVDKALTIAGSTKGKTIIDGHNLDRVFLTLSGKVAMSNLEIEHGQTTLQGGGLWNDGATVTLTSVQFLDNFVDGQFGGNSASGTDDGNVGTAGGAGGAGTAAEGGAICNSGPSLTLTNCFFSENAAIGGNGGSGGNGAMGGGANNREGQFNGAAGDGGAGGNGGTGGAAEGGGVFNSARATLILSGDEFFQNEALGGNGGSGGAGGLGQGGNGANDTGAGAGIGGSAGGGPGGEGGHGGLGAEAGFIAPAARSRSWARRPPSTRISRSAALARAAASVVTASAGMAAMESTRGPETAEAQAMPGPPAAREASGALAATVQAVPFSTPRMVRSPVPRRLRSSRILPRAVRVPPGEPAATQLAARAGKVGVTTRVDLMALAARVVMPPAAMAV
jgi:hypothetical protein